MLKLIIEDDEGRKTVVPFVRDEITIGRQEGNTIRLTERNVSRRHARLVRQNGHVLVEDLGSYNGTRINGERIEGQLQVQDGDLIQIGDYDLALQAEGASATAPAASAPNRKPPPRQAQEDSDTSEDEEQDHTPPPALDRQHATAVIRLDQVEMGRPRKVKTLEPEEAPRLVVLTTEYKGREFACIRTEMKLGRTDENDIVLDHRSLSRTHARLVREDNGEWRVVDMQSANGLKVNGETYAQATLKSGDVVELGHVKLRFVGAGEAASTLDAGGRSKLPLVVGALVVLAVLGAGGFFLLKPRLFPSTAPKAPTEPQQAQATPGKEPAQGTAPQATPTPPAIPMLTAKLKSSRDAIATRDFEQAVTLLESLKDPSGARPSEVESLLDQARGELLARKDLDQALKELEAGKLNEASDTLDGIITTAFEQELGEARTRLQAARAAAAAAAAKPPSGGGKPRPPPRPPENKGADETGRILAEAIQLLQTKQFQEAATMLETCIKREPNNADCHLRLGVAYASTKEIERGAQHYRRFLQLVPADHPRAARVKQLLADYEQQKAAASNK